MALYGAQAAQTASAQVERALLALPGQLAFAQPLEARYRADGKAERLRDQRHVCMLGVTLFLGFLLADAIVVPDVFTLGVVLRGTCFFAALPLVAMLQPRTPDWLVDALVAWFVLPCTITIAVLFALSHSPDRATYLSGIVVSVTLANTCLQQRFRCAAGANLIVFVIVLVALAGSGIQPAVRLLQIGLLLSTMILTLGIAHRLEWQGRRSYLLAVRLSLRQTELERINLQLAHLSDRDGLTGLANRRAVDRHLQASWAASALSGQMVAVIMIDVDCFKRYNDAYGHPAGDSCLRAIGQAMREQIQPDDLAGRYGGEEFIAILRGVDASQAHAVAERIRLAVEALGMPHVTSTAAATVTVSLGLACGRPEPGMMAADLLQAADAALYVAKQSGRARTCFADAVV